MYEHFVLNMHINMHNHLCTVSTEAQIPNGVKHLKLCIFHFKYGPMSWGYFIYFWPFICICYSPFYRKVKHSKSPSFWRLLYLLDIYNSFCDVFLVRFLLDYMYQQVLPLKEPECRWKGKCQSLCMLTM